MYAKYPCVLQVEEEGAVTPGGEGREMTVPAVDSLLALLRPAVANYGGKVEVVSVDGGICQIRYSGPDAIWTVCFYSTLFYCIRASATQLRILTLPCWMDL